MAKGNVDMTCRVCGLAYQADAVRLKHGRQTTCSRACSYAWRASQKESVVHASCAMCGKGFDRWPSHFRSKHGSEFCSRACHYKGRTAGLVARVVVDPYEYTPESKAAQIASAREPKGQRAFHPTTCANCLKVFDDPRDGRKRAMGKAFCSLACCNGYRKGPNHPTWGGGHPKYYGPDWRPLRRAARKRDGYKCQRCGKQPDAAKLPDVHHIKRVGDFANPNDANTLDNVVTLCRSCHATVERNGIDFDISWIAA